MRERDIMALNLTVIMRPAIECDRVIAVAITACNMSGIDIYCVSSVKTKN